MDGELVFPNDACTCCGEAVQSGISYCKACIPGCWVPGNLRGLYCPKNEFKDMVKLVKDVLDISKRRA